MTFSSLKHISTCGRSKFRGTFLPSQKISGLRAESMPSCLHCHTQSSGQQQPSGVLVEEDKVLAVGTFALGSLELKILLSSKSELWL